MTLRTYLMIGAAAGLLAACGQETTAPQTANETTAEPATSETSAEAMAEDANAAFLALAEAQAKAMLTASPESATTLAVDEDMAGGPYNGKLSVYGLAARKMATDLHERFVAEIAAVDRTGLSGQAAVTYDILAASYDIAARRNAIPYGSRGVLGGAQPYPVSQMTGLQINLPRLLLTQQPLAGAKDAEDYLLRLGAIEGAMDAAVEAIEKDAADGVAPPRFALEKIIGGLNSFTTPAPADNPLATAFDARLSEIADIDAEARASYVARATALIETSVYPAYDRMARALQAIAEDASDAPGVWRLPDGGALYQVALDSYGADGKTAEEIHAIGLSEVERILDEMDAILKAEGYEEGTVGERMNALTVDPRFLYPNTDEGKTQLLADLNDLIANLDPMLGDWFGVLPPQPVEVRRIPVYEEAAAPGGYYTGPPLDGSRPGIFWINLRDTAEWPRFDLPTLTYHEAAPGHHFQIALQRDQKGLPIIRNMMVFSEFAEGWALYTELLAKEMGVYDDDPYGDLGRLRAELFRSVRLVVDTGIHHKRWSRDKAIDYMTETLGNQRSESTTEIERYAVLPGQATSYKLGMLKMQELRAEAEAELGDAFDIRAFHDVILLGGMRPLPVLAAEVRRWIAETKS
ncbi:MAG: DUF885 domain-containing protein [Pseudomonadota bacterium]